MHRQSPLPFLPRSPYHTLFCLEQRERCFRCFLSSVHFRRILTRPVSRKLRFSPPGARVSRERRCGKMAQPESCISKSSSAHTALSKAAAQLLQPVDDLESGRASPTRRPNVGPSRQCACKPLWSSRPVAFTKPCVFRQPCSASLRDIFRFAVEILSEALRCDASIQLLFFVEELRNRSPRPQPISRSLKNTNDVNSAAMPGAGTTTIRGLRRICTLCSRRPLPRLYWRRCNGTGRAVHVPRRRQR